MTRRNDRNDRRHASRACATELTDSLARQMWPSLRPELGCPRRNVGLLSLIAASRLKTRQRLELAGLERRPLQSMGRVRLVPDVAEAQPPLWRRFGLMTLSSNSVTHLSYRLRTLLSRAEPQSSGNCTTSTQAPVAKPTLIGAGGATIGRNWQPQVDASLTRSLYQPERVAQQRTSDECEIDALRI